MAVTVLLTPALLIRQPVLIFVLCLAGSLWLSGRSVLRRPRLIMLLPLIAAALAWPFAVIYRAFGQVDMVSFLFHAQAGITGVSPWMLRDEILVTLAALLGILVICWLLAARPALRHLPPVVALMFLLGNPWLIFEARNLLYPVPDVDLATLLKRPEIRPRQLPPDIVHIYMEGTDRRFLDPGLDPETAATLTGLESQGLSFTGIREVAGTGWSIAGTVASQCGVPLMPRGLLDFSIIEGISQSFMPEVTCLGDLLAEQGYRQGFVMGADGRFAGTIAFFTTHGYGRSVTQKDIPGMFPPAEVEAASATWFSDDQMVYDAARQEFAAGLAGDAPFTLTIVTIGPHGVPSYLSRRCTAQGQAQNTMDVVGAARCLTALTRDLVADLQEMHRRSGRQNELRIILQSDHLNHARKAFPDSSREVANFLVLIGGSGAGEQNNRSGTMMDVYPTLLDWLGYPGAGGRAGLGVSLTGQDGAKTLAESWDLPVLDRIIMRNLPLFETLWTGSH